MREYSGSTFDEAVAAMLDAPAGWVYDDLCRRTPEDHPVDRSDNGYCARLPAPHLHQRRTGLIVWARPVSVSSLDQPAPVPNAQPAVWPLVIADMHERDAVGRARYGTPLQPGNGRDALRDAYAEALDLCVYLRQAIHERDGR